MTNVVDTHDVCDNTAGWNPDDQGQDNDCTNDIGPHEHHCKQHTNYNSLHHLTTISM